MTPEQHQLVEDHLHVAERIARAFCGRRGLNYDTHYDDVYADACLGLCQAAARWQPSYGTPFPMFAAVRIKGAILDAARAVLPLSRREYARGETPPDLVPLDAPVADGNDIRVSDTIPDPAPPVDEVISEGEVLRLLEPLTHRHRVVMVLLALGETQREIADRLSLSEGRISQITTAARHRIVRAVLAA